MANATAINVNDLEANGELADPTADVLDTGTSAVTLPCVLGGKTDRVIFKVENSAAEDLDVEVLAGDNPPAFRAGLGSFSATALAQNDIAWIGPLESARFAQDDGDVDIKFTPGGTINAKVTCFRLPTV